MEISLGAVVEDVPYHAGDMGGNCPDSVVYSTGSAASTAICSVWRLCLDNIFACLCLALIIVLISKWAKITDSGSALFCVEQTRRYCVL